MFEEDDVFQILTLQACMPLLFVFASATYVVCAQRIVCSPVLEHMTYGVSFFCLFESSEPIYSRSLVLSGVRRHADALSDHRSALHQAVPRVSCLTMRTRLFMRQVLSGTRTSCASGGSREAESRKQCRRATPAE